MSNFVSIDPLTVKAALDPAPASYRFLVKNCQDNLKFYVAKTCDGIRFVVCGKFYDKEEDAYRALENRSRLSQAFKTLSQEIRENSHQGLPWEMLRPESI